MARIFKSCDLWIVAGLLIVAGVVKGPALAEQVKSFFPGSPAATASSEQESAAPGEGTPATDAAPADPNAAPSSAPESSPAPNAAPSAGQAVSPSFGGSFRTSCGRQAF